ncbi:hypothetical protein Landi51_04596 [Colletotrichum acutatum]
MGTERTVAVQLTEDWTMDKASLAFLFHPSTHPFREVKKNTNAWLHISQKIDGHGGNEWAIITPLKTTPEGLVEIFPGDHSRVDYVNYGYEKADNYVNNRHVVKRRASQMN